MADLKDPKIEEGELSLLFRLVGIDVEPMRRSETAKTIRRGYC